MAVISLTITESDEEIVSGIPSTVSISTNIPSMIFYTLDGTTPTVFSTIYITPISIPTGTPSVILSVFASNGVDNSPIIIQTYETVLLGKNARTPHSGTDAQPNSTQGVINPSPFGTPPIQPNQQFLGAGEAGLTVDNPNLPPGKPTGYDSNQSPTGFTNDQYIGFPTKTFPVQYTQSNAIGEQGYGIGTIPRLPIIEKATPPPERTDATSMMFDPRAFVIIQDLTKPTDPAVPPMINKMHFSVEDVQHTRQGGNYFNVGLEAPTTTGSFLRQHFNPADNTMNYYYFDSSKNTWIISKVPFKPKPNAYNYGSSMVPRKNSQGAGLVFEWKLFKSSYLY